MALKRSMRRIIFFFALIPKGKNFRYALDPNYKANRTAAPEDLQNNFRLLSRGFQGWVLNVMKKRDLKPMMLSVSAMSFCKKHDIKVRIVTHDKDLYQLIEDGRVVIYDPMKNEIYFMKSFEKFGVYPDKIGEYLALVVGTALIISQESKALVPKELKAS